MHHLLYKTIYLIVLFLSISINIGFSQYNNLSYLGKSTAEKGDIEFANQSYAKAAEYYETAILEEPDNGGLMIKLAETYRAMNKMTTAEIWYSKSLDIQKLTPDQIPYYIEVLASNQKYEAATLFYQTYKDSINISARKKDRFEEFAQIEQFYKNQHSYSLSYQSGDYNARDFSPCIFKNGYLFISSRGDDPIIRNVYKQDGTGFLNIYFTEKTSTGQYKKPKIFDSKLASNFHEGPLSIYQNNTAIAITRNQVKNQKAIRDENGINHLGIYFADINNGHVENIKPFNDNSPSYSNAHPAISEDGKTMIFSSDRIGGLGQADLYICSKTENGWNTPINLGNTINTEGRELYPYLTGSTLYFASDGHPGLGGLDIYKALIVDGLITRIENLGYPINSSKDDFGLTTKTDEQGYFSSNRNNEIADGIFSYENSQSGKPKIITKIYAIDSVQESVLTNSSVSLIDTRIDEYIRPIEILADTFVYALDTGVSYSVIAAKRQYVTTRLLQTTTSANDSIDWAVPLNILEVGLKIELNDIYFDFDKATLNDNSIYELNYLVIMLQDNPTMKAEIHSHTDTKGNEKYNNKLSLKRATSVIKYLIDSGIEEYRLTPVSHGESQPLVNCEEKEGGCTESDHKLNRRTDFIVTEL